MEVFLFGKDKLYQTLRRCLFTTYLLVTYSVSLLYQILTRCHRARTRLLIGQGEPIQIMNSELRMMNLI